MKLRSALLVVVAAALAAAAAGEPKSAAAWQCQGAECNAGDEEEAAYLQMSSSPNQHVRARGHRAEVSTDLVASLERRHSAKAGANVSMVQSAETPGLSPTGAATMAFGALVVLLIAAYVQQMRYINKADRDLADKRSEKMCRMARDNTPLALALEKDQLYSTLRKENQMLALRVGVVTVLSALPTLEPHLAKWFAMMNFDTSYTAVLVLWTMGRNVGQTVSGLWDAIVGTFMAWFFVWIIMGFYPGGFFEGDPIEVWLMGFGYFCATTLLMMFGTWRNGVRVWCLSYHVGNMMFFLKQKAPGTAHTYSTSFRVQMDRSAEGYVLITLFSAAICIIALSLPRPRMSHRIALEKMLKTGETFQTLLRSFTHIYLGQVNTDQSVALNKSKDLQDMLRSELSDLKTDISNSWWEHFDLGQYAAVRHSLDKHVEVTGGLLDCVASMQGGMKIALPLWTDQHGEVMKEITQPLSKMIESTLLLYENLCEATHDGAVDAEEAAKIRTHYETVEVDIEALSKDFRTATERICGSGFTKQHALDGDWDVLFVMTSLSRMVADFGKELVHRGEPDRVSIASAVKSYNPLAGMFDPGHVEFAVRNSISLFLCFIVGIFGLFGEIPAYSAGIASNASLLLSTNVGAALKKNTGRVQGLVIGKTIGSLMYAFLVDQGCGTTAYMVNGYLLTFIFACFSFYQFLASEEYSFVFYLFAGFGSMEFLSPCDDNVTLASMGGDFSSILEAVVCVSIMAIVDLSMSAPASGEVVEQAKCFLVDISKCITLMLTDAEVHKGMTVPELRNQLATVNTMKNEAIMEPRFSAAPFNDQLYSHLCKVGTELVVNVQTYRWAIRHNATSTLASASKDLKKGDQEIFPLLQSCKSLKGLISLYDHLLDVVTVCTEELMLAESSVKSVQAIGDLNLRADDVHQLIAQISEELACIDAQNLEKKALDKDIDCSLHVTLFLLKNHIRLLKKLQSSLQVVA